MKVVILNGLLKKEVEKKKIVDVIANQFEFREIYYEKIDLYDWELPMYTGDANAVIEKIFNEFLSADALVFVSSVYFNNISINLKNVFDYFQITKYRVALKSKPIIPVILHNNENYLNAYTAILSFINELEMKEYNKIVLSTPEIINNQFIDDNMDTIKRGICEICEKLAPGKAFNSLTNEKLNAILEDEEKVVDENQLKLELDDNAETDIKKIANMVNEKLSVKQIIEEKKDETNENSETNDTSILKEEKTNNYEQNVTEIASKYKSKIEEIMQLTLGGDDEEENLSENFTEETIEKENYNESLVETKIEDENLNKNENKAENKIDESIEKMDEQKNDENINIDLDNASKLETNKLSEPVNPQIAYPQVAVSSNLSAEEQSREYIRNLVLKRNEITKKREEVIEKQMQESVKEEVSDVKTIEIKDEKIENKVPENEIKEEVASITQRLNEKVNSILEENKKQDENTAVEENTVVEVSKFNFNDFEEEHEVIPYVENTIDVKDNDKNDELKEMTRNLAYLFKAPENENLNLMVQLNISGLEPMNMYINIVDNKCSIFNGINTNSALTINATSDNWKKILAGDVTLQNAFMTGMIFVTGNFVMLSKLDKSLFY